MTSGNKLMPRPIQNTSFDGNNAAVEVSEGTLQHEKPLMCASLSDARFGRAARNFAGKKTSVSKGGINIPSDSSAVAITANLTRVGK